MPRDGNMAPRAADRSSLLRLWRAWRSHAREQRLAAQFTQRDLRDLGSRAATCIAPSMAQAGGA